MTEDQKRGLYVQGLTKLEKLMETAASAVAAVRAHRKVMKSDGFDPAEINYGLYLRKKDEGDVLADFETKARVAKYLSHPIGHQFGLFSNELTVDRTPAVERAFEEGKTAAFADQPCKPPYDASTPQGQRWIDGHHEAQMIIAKGFKTLDDAAGLPGAPPEPESAESVH